MIRTWPGDWKLRSLVRWDNWGKISGSLWLWHRNNWEFIPKPIIKHCRPRLIFDARIMIVSCIFDAGRYHDVTASESNWPRLFIPSSWHAEADWRACIISQRAAIPIQWCASVGFEFMLLFHRYLAISATSKSLEQNSAYMHRFFEASLPRYLLLQTISLCPSDLANFLLKIPAPHVRGVSFTCSVHKPAPKKPTNQSHQFNAPTLIYASSFNTLEKGNDKFGLNIL